MRNWIVVVLMTGAAGTAAAGALAEAPRQSESDGRSLFLACEFKQAARVFEKALVAQPESARLNYWLGKSYARLAEVSGPLSAAKNARKARRSLEEAVRIDPKNGVYLQELFDFYVDSPEWFSGGLERARELLERMDPGESGAGPLLKQLAESRKEYSGAGWWMRRATLRTSGAMGYFVPQP